MQLSNFYGAEINLEGDSSLVTNYVSWPYLTVIGVCGLDMITVLGVTYLTLLCGRLGSLGGGVGHC